MEIIHCEQQENRRFQIRAFELMHREVLQVSVKLLICATKLSKSAFLRRHMQSKISLDWNVVTAGEWNIT